MNAAPPPQATVPEPAATPCARKRGEPSTEELLACINQDLPCSDEAEKGLLSCLLQDPNERLAESRHDLSPRAFYHEANRTLYEKLVEFYDRRLPIDPVLVTNQLRDQNLLDRVGGPAAITETFTYVPSPAHYVFYKKIVQDKFQLRQFIHAHASSIHAAHQFAKQPSDREVGDLMAESKSALAHLESDVAAPELPFQPIAQILDAVVDHAEERARNPGVLPGISTGFQRLDELTGGMQRGCFWTVLAETSEGKSALCRQLVECACEAGHAGVIYTYEMMAEQEGARMVCPQGVVSSDVMKTGRFSRAQQQGLAEAVRKIKDWDIAIVDVAGRCIEDVWRDIARRRRRLKEGQELVAMIDYIQLARTREKFPKQRQQQIAYISGGSKQCAKTNLCTLLMPSQVNKQGDAREGMDIEQDCDVKLIIRPPGQDKNSGRQASPWKSPGGVEDELQKTKRELFLGKNRDGPRNEIVKVRMIGPHFRFETDWL
jgi:replicative DNA helicase